MQRHNDTTETVTQSRDVKQTTIALPIEVWRALRNHSTDIEQSQAQIVIDALRQHLGLNQQKVELQKTVRAIGQAAVEKHIKG